MRAAVLIFTAQASGVSFSWPDYGTILLATLLLSGASSGIPGGGLVKVLIIVQAFNLPLEIAAVVGGEIGRASCRERVCQFVSDSVVAVSLNKNTNRKITTITQCTKYYRN